MTDSDLERYFRTGLFAIVMCLMLIATFHFYFSVQDVIGTWFLYQYQPIFKAIFSLIVIVLCTYLLRFYIISHR